MNSKCFSFTLCILLVIASGIPSFAQLKESEKLLPFSLKALDGAVVTVKTEAGKVIVLTETTKAGKKHVKEIKPDVVLIDFWATWCPPCREEIPHLQKLHEKYHSTEGNGGLVLIGIALERGGVKTLKRFAKEQKLTYILLPESTAKSDTKELLKTVKGAAKSYKVSGIPTTYIIDAQGVIKKVHVGFSTGTEKELEKEIVELLPTPTPPKEGKEKEK